MHWWPYVYMEEEEKSNDFSTSKNDGHMYIWKKKKKRNQMKSKKCILLYLKMMAICTYGRRRREIKWKVKKWKVIPITHFSTSKWWSYVYMEEEEKSNEKEKIQGCSNNSIMHMHWWSYLYMEEEEKSNEN